MRGDVFILSFASQSLQQPSEAETHDHHFTGEETKTRKGETFLAWGRAGAQSTGSDVKAHTSPAASRIRSQFHRISIVLLESPGALNLETTSRTMSLMLIMPNDNNNGKNIDDNNMTVTY